MSIMDKLRKNSRQKFTEVLEDSKLLHGGIVIPTPVPMVNVALSGSIHGGMTAGLGMLAGPSKHFKTSFALLIAAAFLKQEKDGVVLFYDSEFGSPGEYFKMFDVDTSRVLHTPVTNIEEFKFDIIQQLEGIERKDKVLILVDSIGNLASKKELEDAKNENTAADMSRAKALKGLFRMVTPYLKMKDIPMLVVNHTYKEIGLFPKDIVGGGTGSYYSSDWIWILGRRQNKKGTEVLGYDFIINEEKSRFVKEKSKIPITVSWSGGVEPYSGLLELGIAGGFVTKPSSGWYSKDGGITKWREKDTMAPEFWDEFLEEGSEFCTFIENTYKINATSDVDSESFLDEEE
jgi:RecA/RadA recombinase